MIVFKYAYTAPRALDRHLQGDWYSVTDSQGEVVAYLIRRGGGDWVALAEEGGQAVGYSRLNALEKAGVPVR